MDKIGYYSSKVAVILVSLYRLLIRPVIGEHCRFTPTCSKYSIEAFEEFGFVKGLVLTIKRLLRCHPFAPGRHDPIETTLRGK